MNKADLIAELSKVTCTKKEAEAELDCVLTTITKAFKKNDTVTLIGFGTFKVGKLTARTDQNPKTGEAIKIKATKVPEFLAGKGLKDAVNG
jgi:DNA-binding protein HU-beta